MSAAGIWLAVAAAVLVAGVACATGAVWLLTDPAPRGPWRHLRRQWWTGGL